MIAVLFITLFILLLMGTPVFVALTLSSILAILGFTNFPLMIVAQRLIGGIDKFSLMAIPFFIFAANVMKTGGIATRILNWAQTMVGAKKGGMAITTEVACMFFGAVSGSSPATVIAIGGLTYPKMIEKGYPKGFTTGLITSSGSVALLIPPSITAIVYGSVTGVSVGALFMGGLTAGLVYGLVYLAYIAWYARKHNIPADEPVTYWEKLKATKDAAWALGVPVIILGGIYSGVFTPTEAAGISVVYSIFVSIFIYREMTLKQLLECSISSAGSTAQVMILLAVASVFGWVLTIGQVPQSLSRMILSANLGAAGFLLLTNLLMLVEGMFIDGSSAVVITAPLLFGAAMALGIHPIHLGVIMVANAAIGMFTPPFGLNLFVAQPVTGNDIKTIFAGVMPFILISLLALALITYVPAISLWLPRMIYGII
ncbi:C4-dicarboxylate TRAP transporter large permease protein DctM [anaerobic digester metagenome]